MRTPVFFKRLSQSVARLRNRKKDFCVLLVGDEGAIFLRVEEHEVVVRLFSPSVQDEATSALKDAAEAGAALPLYIIFDTVDQAYIQQTLPPVAALSVHRLMRRRLDREFSNDYLKGAYITGREVEKRRDWMFLMVAMQQTPVVRAWLELAAGWPNMCAGIYMLPLEAYALNRLLQAPAESAKKNRKWKKRKTAMPADKWELLVCFNKVSGVRQMLYKNGQLILTRITAHTDEKNPEVAAGAMEQEIIATREYIKRLMHMQSTELNLQVIVPEDLKAHIDIARLGNNVHIRTPFEIGGMLNIRNASQLSDRYCDSILALSIVTARRRKLPILSPELKLQKKYYLSLKAVRRASLVIVLALLAFSLSNVWGGVVSTQEIASLEKQQKEKLAAMQELKEKAEMIISVNLDKIIDVTDLHKHLEEKATDPVELLKALHNILLPKGLVKTITWSKAGKDNAFSDSAGVADAAAQKNKSAIEMHIDLELMPQFVTSSKQAEENAIDAVNALKTQLPQYDITFLPLPGAVSENQQIDVTLSKAATPVHAEVTSTIHLTIKGPTTNDTVAVVPGAPHGQP